MKSNNKKHLLMISIIWVVSLSLSGVYVVKAISGEKAPNMFSDPYTSAEWPEMTDFLQHQVAMADSNNVSVQFDSTAQTPPAAGTPRKYSGNVGKLNAEFTLSWKADGSIEGNYYYPSRRGKVYDLKGKAKSNGTIDLEEYTKDQLTARCTLQPKGDCYEGTMNNTNGKKFDMKLCKIQTAPAPSKDQLIIQGTKVNVRSSPGKQAAVIMQLNTGDVCTIVQKGTTEVIDGHNDYWYHVSFKGKTGWVFGAFTSLKAANS